MVEPSTVRSWHLLLGTAVLALVLVGCGDGDGPDRTSRVSGTVQIADIADVAVRNKAQTTSCYGTGPYEGVEEGARVVVKDASGTDVSTGRLGQGRLVFDPNDLLEQAGASGAQPQSCVLGFVVEGVPPVGDSWSLRIGEFRFDLPPEETSSLDLSLG